MTLWRYILRAHAGPFLFANAIIIFLFLLQFLMKSAGDLVGKGLGILVILELIALNLAWMVVLAVPMAVLVSTLMAFGRLAADNETTIMRASGMSLYRMMFPVVLMTGLVTWGLVYFNNAILPEANIRLRTLMTDIVRIKPTLTLRSGVFTSEEEIPNYRILVRRAHDTDGRLEGVTIYDLSRPDKHVVVTARTGRVNFSRDYSKIFMDLEDGEIHDLTISDMTPYRTLEFARHRVAIPASGFGFQRSDASTAQRDDRTMSAQMMQAIVDSIGRVSDQGLADFGTRMREQMASYLDGRPQLVAPAPMPSPDRTTDTLARHGTTDALVRHGTTDALVRHGATDTLVRHGATDTLVRHADTLSTAVTARIFSREDSLAARYRARIDLRQLQSEVAGRATMRAYERETQDKYLVEIYKKYSIPFACMVFVLIGAPLGMMARKGGFGVGAGLSLGFFLFYWAFLIGGEKLADRTVLSPFWGMWAANIVLGVVGIVFTMRAARETPVIDWSMLSRFVPKRLRGRSV